MVDAPHAFANPGHADGLAATAPERARLARHPLPTLLRTIEDVRTFLEHHVYAVFDFMSLLKALQRELTCVDVPWTPRGDAMARRLVNEIVLAEESDEDPRGGFLSHFELYLAAMDEAGADASPARALAARVASGTPIRVATEDARIPAPARAFMHATFTIVDSASPAAIAAAFTIGREEVIPPLFIALADELERGGAARLSLYRHYLRRHIALDGEDHGPLARRLLDAICRDDGARATAARAAQDALRARLALWDGIAAAVGARRSRAAAAGR